MAEKVKTRDFAGGIFLVLEMFFLNRSQRRVFARAWRPRKTTDRNVIVRRVALHTTIRRCH